MWKTSRSKLKKHSVTKKFSDLSLFEKIVLVFSKNLANSRPTASNFKSVSWSLEQFFLKNFRKKIPLLSFVLDCYYGASGINSLHNVIFCLNCQYYSVISFPIFTRYLSLPLHFLLPKMCTTQWNKVL